MDDDDWLVLDDDDWLVLDEEELSDDELDEDRLDELDDSSSSKLSCHQIKLIGNHRRYFRAAAPTKPPQAALCRTRTQPSLRR